MRFEWDAAKAASNLAKHEVTFEEASTIFEDPLFITFEDPDRSLAERRFLMMGQSRAGNLLVVAYTEAATGVRLISARKASRRERRAYEQDL